jgi:adenosine deaminase
MKRTIENVALIKLPDNISYRSIYNVQKPPFLTKKVFNFTMNVIKNIKEHAVLTVKTPSPPPNHPHQDLIKTPEAKAAYNNAWKQAGDETRALWGQRLDSIPAWQLRKLYEVLQKVEFHSHVEGAIRAEAFLEAYKSFQTIRDSLQHELGALAGDQALLAKIKELVQVSSPTADLKEFLKKFDYISLFLKEKEAIPNLVKSVVVEAVKENVVYLELRISPMYICGYDEVEKGGKEEAIKQMRIVMEKALQGIASGKNAAGNKIEVNFTVMAERQLGPEKAMWVLEAIKPFIGRGVVAVDLANNEYDFPPGEFIQFFQEAKSLGLFSTCHAGESENYGAQGPQNILTAILELGVNSVGHASNAVYSAVALNLLRVTQTAAEICFSSNLLTGACKKITEHLFKLALTSGIPSVICTDDQGVANITLTDEYMKALEAFPEMTVADLAVLMLHSAQHAFLPVVKKSRLQSTLFAGLEQFSKRMSAALQHKEVDLFERLFS